MSTTGMVVLTVFIAIFVQIWFTNFLYKTHILMLRTRYEKSSLNGFPTSLEHLREQCRLFEEYREVLRKFLRRIYTISLIVNLTITSTAIFFIVE